MTSNIPVFPPPHTDLQCRVLCLFNSGFLFSYLIDIYRASVPGDEMNLTLFSWLVPRKGRKNESLHQVIHIVHFVHVDIKRPQTPRLPGIRPCVDLRSGAVGLLVISNSIFCPRHVQAPQAIQLGLAQLGGPAARSLVT